MSSSHRLMCESWVEKRPEVNYVASQGTSSLKNNTKWKTRYAMLIVSCETRMSEVRFYQKKPRSYTEITDDVIKLQPWQYTVDVPSWIVDKGRPHVLRLRLLPESVVPGQQYRIQIAYQSSEETTAWMRCIQNQTKLTSGIQGHSFGVVAEESSATSRVGVAGKHCLLFVGPEKVILANKTDRSVVCVWPFPAIRSYASDDDRRLVIEAGRCAPLGEGVYSFRTRENDDNVLFDLFDHYIAQAAEEHEMPKKGKKERKEVIPPDQAKSAPPTVDSVKKSRKGEEQEASVMSSDSSRMTVAELPPAKPPLPEDRRTLRSGPSQPGSATTSANDERPPHPSSSDKKTEKRQKQSPKRKKDTASAKTEKRPVSDGTHNRDSVKNGIYDLDKLLYSLESTIRYSQGNLSEKESVGYASPTSKVAEVSFSDDQRQNPELAYAINTIKAGDVMGTANAQPDTNGQTGNSQSKPDDVLPHARDLGQYDNCPADETEAEGDLHKPADAVSGGSVSSGSLNSRNIDKPLKPKIAPKPPSVKIPKPAGVRLSDSGEPLQKTSPPYAKVDSGKRAKK